MQHIHCERAIADSQFSAENGIAVMNYHRCWDSPKKQSERLKVLSDLINFVHVRKVVGGLEAVPLFQNWACATNILSQAETFPL